MGLYTMKRQDNNTSVWILVIGVLMILMGVYVWFNPAEMLLALAFYFGVVFLMTGVGYLLAFFSGWSGWVLAQGLLDVFVGVIFLANINLTAISIPIMFAFWALFVGVIRIMAAVSLHREGASHWFWAFISGIIGIAFGFLIMANPLLGAFTITMFIGVYMMLYGLLAVVEYFSGR